MSERERVKLLVLQTGEHICGEVVGEEDGITISKPVSIVPHPDPSMGGKLVFMPYLQLTDETECTFPVDNIRHILVPKKGLVDDWSKQFGSGIEVPSENIILG